MALLTLRVSNMMVCTQSITMAFLNGLAMCAVPAMDAGQAKYSVNMNSRRGQRDLDNPAADTQEQL